LTVKQRTGYGGLGRPERTFGADVAAKAVSIAERRDLGRAEAVGFAQPLTGRAASGVVNSTAVSHYNGATVLSE